MVRKTTGRERSARISRAEVNIHENQIDLGISADYLNRGSSGMRLDDGKAVALKRPFLLQSDNGLVLHQEDRLCTVFCHDYSEVRPVGSICGCHD